MMGRKKKQGREYSNLNPNAAEFIPAVVSTCEGKYSADERARYRIQERDWIPKSSRPAPYMNNNTEKLSFSFLGLESDTEEENPGVDFVSEMPTLVLEEIFQLLDVTSIQNCRKVCHNWNNAIIHRVPIRIRGVRQYFCPTPATFSEIFILCENIKSNKK